MILSAESFNLAGMAGDRYALVPEDLRHRLDDADDLAAFDEAYEYGGMGKLHALLDRWRGQANARKRREEDAAEVVANSRKLREQMADLTKSTKASSKVWLNRAEAAEYLGVSAKTIDRRREEGKLKAHLLDGSTAFRFKKEDLDELMR